jgi:hypothetical protein
MIMKERSIKMLDELMKFIKKHYPDNCLVCEEDEDTQTIVMPHQLELELIDVDRKEDVIGQIWYECPKCSHFWSNDFRIE